MFAEKGLDLLKELKRVESVPPYNEAQLKAVFAEINSLHQEIQNLLRQHGSEAKTQPYYFSSLLIQHSAILRNKRVVLAYLNERLKKVKQLRWELGSFLIPAEVKQNLSSLEFQFLVDYDKMLNSYSADIGFDLSGDLDHPPKDLFIEVRALTDVGEIMTENGVLNLQKNSTYFLRRNDVEHHIRLGLLEHVVS
eukprot:TRINITY_DN5741_c0_g1_i1.p1 TRINITY_DN5741_c0_g1~~TRINITY_DN5741_c0_g1_i1.p1  ORF type:complete len:209 (-),score=47.72 TRINITY_DN5741_c0_g1_i1:105-686(-)